MAVRTKVRSPAKVEEVLRVFQDGAFVKLKIGFPRFEYNLKAQDLGLKEDEVPEIFRLGKKKIMPAEVIAKFHAIDISARRVVEDCSVYMPIFDDHFVPLGRLEEIDGKLTSHYEEFMGQRDRFMSKYDEYRDQMLLEFEKYRSTFEKLYPRAIEVRSRFHFSWFYAEVTLPKRLQAKAVDMVRKKKAGERSERIIAENSRKIVESFDTWAETVVIDARKAAAKLCETIKDKIEKKEVVHHKTVEALENYIESFRKMNFIGDRDFEKLLDDARKTISGGLRSEDAQESFAKAAQAIQKAAEDTSDISEVTGAYRRREIDE